MLVCLEGLKEGRSGVITGYVLCLEFEREEGNFSLKSNWNWSDYSILGEKGVLLLVTPVGLYG